jgi:hypothetical protein
MLGNVLYLGSGSASFRASKIKISNKLLGEITGNVERAPPPSEGIYTKYSRENVDT